MGNKAYNAAKIQNVALLEILNKFARSSLIILRTSQKIDIIRFQSFVALAYLEKSYAVTFENIAERRYAYLSI
ncbi:MAG: hypothetical protein K2L61_00870 [Clostridia bacterium]|nr:hypothetical protein [Clostridia bacterium]